MNAVRRTALAKILDRITTLRADAESIGEDVSATLSDEQAYRDAMPASLGDGEKGEKADAAIEALEAAESELEDVLAALDEARSKLEEASA